MKTTEENLSSKFFLKSWTFLALFPRQYSWIILVSVQNKHVNSQSDSLILISERMPISRLLTNFTNFPAML